VPAVHRHSPERNARADRLGKQFDGLIARDGEPGTCAASPPDLASAADDGHMNDLGDLAQQTAGRLAAQRAGVVVAAVAGDAAEIRAAGQTSTDAVFEIGSVTKVFTALALARLTITGATDLDEPLAELLPPGARTRSRDGTEITLRHLATHTSGLPRLPTGMLLQALLRPSKDPYAGCTTDRLLQSLARTRLGATPGRRFRYSNFGAGLLGLALARRAGIDYETLITREISAPLGLTDTGITVPAGRLAQGHTRRGRPTPPWNMADLAGAGGLRSTAADLVRFLRAQLAAEPDPAIRLTREVKHRINPFAWVHLGWMGRRLHAEQGGHLQLWHNGGTGGFSSFVGFDPEKSVAVVALSSTQRTVDGPASELLRSLQATR
jgi:CubicO group peptidase (beta-lactamase class C family)